MEGFVYTSTYADTAATFKDAKRFSSAEGFRGAGVVVPDEESFLGEIDPPLHPRVRRLLHRAFTPRTALEVEPFTRELTEELLAPIVANGGGDLMVGLCTVLPVAVSAEALGIPREQHAEVAHWCQELLHSTWPEKNETERGVGVGGGFPEFAEIIDAQIRLRRESADPPDDLLTRMTYDSFTVTVLLALEDLGFCAKGEGGAFVEDGRLRPAGSVPERRSGSLPTNTNGGGLCYTHPGMYGMFLITEAARQVQGDAGARQVSDAEIAVAHGCGVVLSTFGTVVLGKDAS